jgi:hypothetical protein
MMLSRPYQISRLAVVLLAARAGSNQRKDDLEAVVHQAAQLLEIAEELYPVAIPPKEGTALLLPPARGEVRSGRWEDDSDLDPSDEILRELAEAERRAREHREAAVAAVARMLAHQTALLEEVHRKVSA